MDYFSGFSSIYNRFEELCVLTELKFILYSCQVTQKSQFLYYTFILLCTLKAHAWVSYPRSVSI